MARTGDRYGIYAGPFTSLRISKKENKACLFVVFPSKFPPCLFGTMNAVIITKTLTLVIKNSLTKTPLPIVAVVLTSKLEQDGSLLRCAINSQSPVLKCKAFRVPIQCFKRFSIRPFNLVPCRAKPSSFWYTFNFASEGYGSACVKNAVDGFFSFFYIRNKNFIRHVCMDEIPSFLP